VEPRTRDERDAQTEREEPSREYVALGRELGRETDQVIAELRVRLAERVRDGGED
jgi:hypothetical protein